MEMIPVKSSNILSIGFDAKDGTLAVKFKSGGVYHYTGVDTKKHADLMKASSIGSFLEAHVKGKHQHKKMR